MDYQPPPPVNQVSHSVSKRPRVFLWVWRYDADMNWIDTKKYGIAYLASTVKIGKNGIVNKPRLNSLKLPDNSQVEAVVRLEVEPGIKPRLSQVKPIQKIVVAQVPLNKVNALQIDFDATKSQRKFYKELAKELRSNLPENKPLKMTALASWTLFDRWTDDMPVNSIIPMFFRMGKDKNRVVNCLVNGMVKNTNCIGLAVDEPDVFKKLEKRNRLSRFKRVYLFSPGGWANSKSKSFANQLSENI